MIVSARRAAFPQSNVHLGRFERGTTNVGTLRPVAFFPIVPADDVFFAAKGLVRALPIKLPFLAGFEIRMDMFFCPYKLYNKSLRDNNVSTFNPDSVEFPRISFAGMASSGIGQAGSIRVGAYLTSNAALYANRGATISYYAGNSRYLGTSFPFVEAGSFANHMGLPSGFFNGYPRRTDGAQAPRITFSALRYLSYVDVFRNYYANLQLKYASMAPASLYSQPNGQDIRPRLRPSPAQYVVPCDYLDKFIEAAYEFTPQPLSNPNLNVSQTEFITSGSDSGIAIETLPAALTITENLCTRDGGLFLRSFAPYYQESWIDKAKYDSGPGSVSVQVEDNQVLLTSIRSGSKILKFKELSVAGGYRYDDFLDVQFDVKTTADTTVPVFLGSARGSLDSDPLYQLAPGESELSGIGKGLGAIGGTSMGTIGCSPRRWTFHEFGEIMVLLSLVPRVSYFSGIDPFLEKTTLNTLYYPALDRLGFQPLMHRNAVSSHFVSFSEVLPPVTSPNDPSTFTPYYFLGDVNDAPDQTPAAGSFSDYYNRSLGYQPAWSEYTIGVDRVCGDLTTTLRPWALTRNPGSDMSGNLTPLSNRTEADLRAGYDHYAGEMNSNLFTQSLVIDATHALGNGSGSYLSPAIFHDTYIHPSDFNYLFEDTRADAHNFVYEISFQCDVRREKSKLNMPTFGL